MNDFESASDLFARIVGFDVIGKNPYARAVWESLRAYEDHHHTVHKDCEDRTLERIRLAMKSLTSVKLSLPE